MKILLGISSKKLSIENENLFWCTHSSFQVTKGDLLVLYIKGKGISQILRIIKDPNIFKSEINCEIRGMQTIYVEIEYSLDFSIKASELKTNILTKDLSFVRKNFQGTTFLLSKSDWKQLSKLMIQKNPNLKKQFTQAN